MLWTTNATGDGVAYTQAQASEMWRMLFVASGDWATHGVVKNYLNELAVTVAGGARTLTIATGGALVYGFPYFSSAAETKTLTHPTTGTTGWRLVLRASWAAQTVRITLVESADGTAAIPAVTQVANTTWDISLAYGTITTGDVVAITLDTRAYVTGCSYFSGGDVPDHFPTGSITGQEIIDRTRRLVIPAVAEWAGGVGVSRLNAYGWTLADGATQVVGGNFQVPVDYVSGLTIKAVLGASGTGNLYCSHNSTSGANGEAWATHTNTTGVVAVAVTSGLRAEVCTLTPGAVDINDYFELEFFRYGANVLDTVGDAVTFLGWVVTYLADS
jgi:hypothetical protein